MIQKSKYAAQNIPTRIRFAGDKEKGRQLVGFAKKQFARRLEIDGANKYNSHLINNRRWPTLESNQGDLIEMQMIQGVSFITIDVPVTAGGKVVQKEKFFCYCDCAATAGIVKTSPASDEEFPEKWIPESLEIYEGMLCQKEKERVLVKDIIGLDFFPHRDAEPKDLSLDGEDNPMDTRLADNVYAIALEKAVLVEGEDPKHIRQPDVEPCFWDTYAFLSIEPLDRHLKVTQEIV